uniref:Mediator complex subunit 11 n=1 Tax=Triticum urartu TaxID=4572 RepID=A0A8R7V8L4_TRIUA
GFPQGKKTHPDPNLRLPHRRPAPPHPTASPPPSILACGDVFPGPEQLARAPPPRREADSAGAGAGGDGHGGAGELAGSPRRGRRRPLPRVHALHEGTPPIIHPPSPSADLFAPCSCLENQGEWMDLLPQASGCYILAEHVGPPFQEFALNCLLMDCCHLSMGGCYALRGTKLEKKFDGVIYMAVGSSFYKC